MSIVFNQAADGAFYGDTISDIDRTLNQEDVRMKDKPNKPEQCPTELGKPAPQLALRTGLRAGADAGCEEGVGYWRKEFNYWKNLAKSMGCA